MAANVGSISDTREAPWHGSEAQGQRDAPALSMFWNHSRKEVQKQMNKNTRLRIAKAEKRALESLDYILETVPTPDFVKVVGCVGGDTVTYRIYDDGSIYEK